MDIPFRNIRRWDRFALNGVVYRKIRKSYGPDRNLVNAKRVSDGLLVYILPSTKVRPVNDIHLLRRNVIMCEPWLE